MADITNLNLWTSANDWTWTDLRSGGQIINDNFEALNDGKLEDIIAGTNVTIDKTDPLNPIINATGWGTWGWDMLSTNNLSDVADIATSRDNLWVYSETETDALLNAKQDVLAEWAFVDWDKTKLDWIAENATVNEADVYLLDRANHTWTQEMETISNAWNLATLNTVWTTEIEDEAVTFWKIESIATNRILGRNSSGNWDVEAITIPTFKSMVSIDNVDNTSDEDKPVSTATQTALDNKVWTTWDETIAWIKTFSDSPIVPTPTTDSQAATKKYVDDNSWGWGGWSYEYAMIKYSVWITAIAVWWTQPLDTIVYDTGGNLSLASNQFTLDEWTYIISWDYLTYRSGWDYAQIYNVTDSTTEYYSTIGLSPSTAAYASICTMSLAWQLIVWAWWRTYEIRAIYWTETFPIDNWIATGTNLQFIKIS